MNFWYELLVSVLQQTQTHQYDNAKTVVLTAVWRTTKDVASTVINWILENDWILDLINAVQLNGDSAKINVVSLLFVWSTAQHLQSEKPVLAMIVRDYLWIHQQLVVDNSPTIDLSVR